MIHATTTRAPAAIGIFPDMPQADYHRLDATSRSDLLALMRSPAYYQWRLEHPQPETPAMRIGTAIHTAILEPDRFARDYAVGPDVKLNTKAGKEQWADFAQAHPDDVILLRAHEGAQVHAIADAVRKSSAASKLLQGGGETETTVVWEDPATGVICRARPDRWFKSERGHVVLDLKSTRDAEPRAFRNQIARAKYDLQLAFYGDGMCTALGLDEEPIGALIAYEKPEAEKGVGDELVTAPPTCSVHVVSPTAMAAARAEYREVLVALQECRRIGQWPDFSSTVYTYDRPSWAETWSMEERWR